MNSYECLTELKKELNSYLKIHYQKIDSYTDLFDINLAFHSARINGAELTLEETNDYLIYGYTSSGKDLLDYLITQDIFDAQKYFSNIPSTSQLFDSSVLKEIHKRLLNGMDYRINLISGKKINKKIVKGDYRGREPGFPLEQSSGASKPSYKNISTEVNLLLEELHYNRNFTIEYSCRVFYKFLKIHPFEIGNGRISRIIINYPLIKGGFQPVIFKLEDKELFSDSIKEADSGNYSKLEDLVRNKIVESYQQILQFIKKF